MKFEFEHEVAERKRLDRLNSRFAVGPGKFALLWCCCFVPTVVCLMWLGMWSVVFTGCALILMASSVPAIVRLRAAKPLEYPRTIELTPIGKRETCGDTVMFVKWDAIDEVVETEHDFMFSRNERYSLLPKRVVDPEQLQEFRDAVAIWRNKPEAATKPIPMFQQLLVGDAHQTWDFELSREDIIAASKSSSLRQIFDDRFSFKDVESSRKSRRWKKILVIGLLLKLALILILGSLPPNRIELGPLVVFLCLNPFVLLVAMGVWIRRQVANGVPRFRNERYRIGLFDGGWAVGNEDSAAFNKWNVRSVFYLAKEFIGIRTDLALVHVLPVRGFEDVDGIWQFLDRAIRLKRSWLHRKTGQLMHTQTSDHRDNDSDPAVPVNPYRSPSVSEQ